MTLEGGPGRVAIALICAQSFTYTYASISSYLGGAGFIKVNLNPLDWRDPEDRAAFLDDCAPEIYSGDPLSFLALMRLPLRHRPRALVSTSMELAAGVCARARRPTSAARCSICTPSTSAGWSLRARTRGSGAGAGTGSSRTTCTWRSSTTPAAPRPRAGSGRSR